MRSGLIARFRERGVLRVAARYAVIAWLALQIAGVVLQSRQLQLAVATTMSIVP
jgi:hypothetical protein